MAPPQTRRYLIIVGPLYKQERAVHMQEMHIYSKTTWSWINNDTMAENPGRRVCALITGQHKSCLKAALELC